MQRIRKHESKHWIGVARLMLLPDYNTKFISSLLSFDLLFLGSRFAPFAYEGRLRVFILVETGTVAVIPLLALLAQNHVSIWVVRQLAAKHEKKEDERIDVVFLVSHLM